jgi:5'(3')-deoxyribonucleotidase
MPKILFVDMDNTLVDFGARLAAVDPALRERYRGRADELPGLFALMPPVPGAIDAFTELAGLFDTYILSTAPWGNPSAWQHKVEWVRLHFGSSSDSPAYKRLILSHHKDLCRGDFLVDDRPAHNGANRFSGEVIAFASERFPDWPTVVRYLRERA